MPMLSQPWYMKLVEEDNLLAFYERPLNPAVSRTFLILLVNLDLSLKLGSAIFYQIYIFSPYNCLLKIMKNVFYFI